MRLIDADVLTVDYKDIYWEGGEKFVDRYVSKYQIDNAPTIEMPQWISCEKKMPNIKEKFFLISGYVGVGVGWWNGSEFLSSTLLPHDEVIAWMPLPEPYMGERKDDETN